MYLLALPDDVLEKILSYVSYDEVSRCRLVCQRFNETSKRILNHGFHKVEKYHAQCLKHVKSQLPRRESERRKHPLARHCDILTAVETRLSLLGMTFTKYIDLNICCFIPGKVLDEIYKVLRYVTGEQSPIRAHEVLQELRDLSSMAMEYFDEKVAPTLKKHKDTGPKINVLCASIKHIRPSVPHNHKESRLLKLAHFVNELAKRQNNLSTDVTALKVKKKEVESLGKRVSDLEQLLADSKKRLTESERLIAEQQITISQQGEKIKEQQLKLEQLSEVVYSKLDAAVATLNEDEDDKKTFHIEKEPPQAARLSKRKLLQKSESSQKKVKK